MADVWTTSGIHNQVVGSNRILPSRRGPKAWPRESRAGRFLPPTIPRPPARHNEFSWDTSKGRFPGASIQRTTGSGVSGVGPESAAVSYSNWLSRQTPQSDYG